MVSMIFTCFADTKKELLDNIITKGRRFYAKWIKISAIKNL